MPTGASSQSYPNRPIRVIVPIGAGGLTDIVARTVAERLDASPEWVLTALGVGAVLAVVVRRRLAAR